jgi:hypothetical protein
MSRFSIMALGIAALTLGALPNATAGSPSIIEVRTTVQSVDDFREPLAEHGQWMDTEEYGLVWQPYVAVADVSWRPYYHGGSWIWTNRGWYWQSTYAWGWAPFHYGRWAATPMGWVWVPDTVWTPACVEWKRTSSYVGWAPVCAVPRQTSRLSIAAGRGGFSIGIEITDEDRYCFVPDRCLPDQTTITYVVPCAPPTIVYRDCTPPVYVVREEPRHHRRHHDRDNHSRRDEGRDANCGRRDADEVEVIVRREPAPQPEPPRSISVNPGRRTEGLRQIATRDRAPAPAAITRPDDSHSSGRRAPALRTSAAPAPQAPAPQRAEKPRKNDSVVQMQASAKPSSAAIDAFRRRMKGE